MSTAKKVKEPQTEIQILHKKNKDEKFIRMTECLDLIKEPLLRELYRILKNDRITMHELLSCFLELRAIKCFEEGKTEAEVFEMGEISLKTIENYFKEFTDLKESLKIS
ncbi:MAG: hypothetical protein WCL14_03450 [Bacteroidota bacterium]